MYIQHLNQAIQESFKKYKEHGARSPEKLFALHTYLGNTIQKIFGTEYAIKFKDRVGNKEKKVVGKYYDKDVDITVLKQGKPVFCLGVKFITSNFNQNANNYFENMMGETANIQAIGIPYAQIIILRQNAPYYEKDGTLKNLEKIQQHHLIKYLNLVEDTVQAYRPPVTCIHIVEIDDTKQTISNVDISEIIEEPDIQKLFKSKMSYTNFIKEIKNIKIAMELDG